MSVVLNLKMVEAIEDGDKSELILL